MPKRSCVEFLWQSQRSVMKTEMHVHIVDVIELIINLNHVPDILSLRICNHLPPNRHALARFVTKQVRKIALPIFVEGKRTSCKGLYLLPTTASGWVRGSLVNDVQICMWSRRAFVPQTVIS